MSESSPLAHSPTLVQSDAPTGQPASSGAPGDRAAEDDLAPGTAVGEFVVDHYLGAGAMGEVYAGSHPVIGKKVAIKVLKRALSSTADGAERFKREARAAGQVAHPNVVDVFSFGRLDDGRLFLVMDLVEGRSLRKAITAAPLAQDSALRVLDKIADALDAAHAKGVVHRDLKPDNVMLGSDDATVHVLDFGLAKLLSPDGVAPASMLTGQGTWLGTPGYMAPEQWSADGAGPASDRYALGVMAFELLSGSLPFEARNLPQMMEQHFRAKVPALSSRGATPAASVFDPVLTRAMAKDPDARFASAKAMVEALRAVAPASKANAKTAAAPSSSARALPAIAGVGVLGVAIAAVVMLRGPSSTNEPGVSSNRPAAPPPPTGSVRVEIVSIPDHCEVVRAGATKKTPTSIDAAIGERVELDIKRPGYVAQHYVFTAEQGLRVPVFQLVSIEGFQGVWRLPSGELRAFHRVADRVEVFKLDSLDGEQKFFRAYDLVDAPAGASFAATDTILQPGRPDDASCHLPMTTEYHYDPTSDALSVRREKLVTTVVDGKCVKKSSDMTAPEVLARVDRTTAENERETMAPVGRPLNIKQLTEEKAKKQALSKSVKPISKAPPAQLQNQNKANEAANFTPLDDPSLGAKNAEPPQKQAPQQAAPPQAEPPIQKQAPAKGSKLKK